MMSSVRREAPRDAGDSRTLQNGHSRTPPRRRTAVDPAEDLNPRPSDVGVSPLDLLALGNVAAREFTLTVSPDACAKAETVRTLIERRTAGTAFQ